MDVIFVKLRAAYSISWKALTPSDPLTTSPGTYAGNFANRPLARRNQGRSRLRKYRGIVGIFSKILWAQTRASAFRPCDSKNSA